MTKANPNTYKKAVLVKQLLDQNYENGNQAKMMAGCLRTKISKVYPISYRTLMRYMALIKNPPTNTSNQLELFDQ